MYHWFGKHHPFPVKNLLSIQYWERKFSREMRNYFEQTRIYQVQNWGAIIIAYAHCEPNVALLCPVVSRADE